MRTFFAFIFLLFSYSVFSQTITVVDAATKKTIANVLVYQEQGGWSVSTNEKGKADISKAKDDIMFFQHPSYQEFAIMKENRDMTVALTEKIIHVEEVVVSANRWEQDIDKVPQEIMSISKSTIEQSQPQTSADMLAATGQVFVQKSQLGGGSPMLRGFAANNVLLVVDGVRMNNAIYRSGNLQNVINIDPLALEGTEVVFGPGSVIYGSDALGGVMDFHTITPQFSTDKTLFSGQVLARHSTANKEKTGHVHLTVGRPKLSFFTSFTFSDFENLRAGKNFPDKYPDFGKNPFLVIRQNGNDVVINNPDPEVQNPSGFSMLSNINKLRYRAGAFDFTYSFYYSTTSNFSRYDRLIELDDNGIPSDAEWYYGPQSWMMNSLKAEFFGDKKLFDQARLVIANQQVKESRHDRGFGSSSLRNQYEEVDVWSANLDFDKQFEKSSLYYGFEAVTNDVGSSANRKNINTVEIDYTTPSRYPSGGSKWNSYAAYASYSRSFNELELNGGLRYSFITMEAKNKDTGMLGREDMSLENGAVTGSIGAVYKFNDNWRLRSNLSSGFRAPNIDDVGKIFEVSDNTISVPNQDLKPQYTYSAEISGAYTSNKLLLDMTLYQTWVTQVMTRNPFQYNGNSTLTNEDGEELDVVALTNSGKAQIHGLTASLKYELTKTLGFTTNFTYTWGEEENGTPLRHVPPAFGQWRILFRKDAFNSSVYMNYNVRRSPEDIALNERESKPHLFAPDGSTPAWYTLNINAAYHFEKGFTARIIAENLLDRHYRTYSSGISAPGRNFIFSLSKTF